MVSHARCGSHDDICGIVLPVCVLGRSCYVVLCCCCMLIRRGLNPFGPQAEGSISGSTPHLEVWFA